MYVLFILAAPVDKSTTSTIKILFWPTCAFLLEASEIAMQHHAVIILFFFNKALFAECTQLGYVSSCGYVRAVTVIWCVEKYTSLHTIYSVVKLVICIYPIPGGQWTVNGRRPGTSSLSQCSDLCQCSDLESAVRGTDQIINLNQGA